MLERGRGRHWVRASQQLKHGRSLILSPDALTLPSRLSEGSMCLYKYFHWCLETISGGNYNTISPEAQARLNSESALGWIIPPMTSCFVFLPDSAFWKIGQHLWSRTVTLLSFIVPRLEARDCLGHLGNSFLGRTCQQHLCCHNLWTAKALSGIQHGGATPPSPKLCPHSACGIFLFLSSLVGELLAFFGPLGSVPFRNLPLACSSLSSAFSFQ